MCERSKKNEKRIIKSKTNNKIHNNKKLIERVSEPETIFSPSCNFASQVTVVIVFVGLERQKIFFSAKMLCVCRKKKNK